MKLIIIGAPNSGKGTQAKILARKFELVYFSTGAFFRDYFLANENFNGYTREQFNRGILCPNGPMNDFIQKLSSEGTLPKDNFIIDSYPRTVPQANYFYTIAQEKYKAIYLSITKDTSLERARIRSAGVEQRLDDTGDTPESRWRVFKEQTYPLMQLYNRRGMLIKQDGAGKLEDISRQLEEKVRRAF